MIVCYPGGGRQVCACVCMSVHAQTVRDDACVGTKAVSYGKSSSNSDCVLL